jgi:hypothetical protein
MTSNQKGAIAETSITLAAIKLGIGVLRPIFDGHRYDLVFDVGDRLLRVQCKWVLRDGDVIEIRCRTGRRGPNGFLHGVHRRDEVDLIAGYCADLDTCYALPPEVFDGHAAITLRLGPRRNGQHTGIRWARDFELGRLDFSPHGAIAQLGERRAGSAKVAGSSPAGSIPLERRRAVLCARKGPPS